jgi:DNA repair protein RecO (recombination protein O)
VSQERTEAVVLRGTDFSETSRIVTLFTPGRGKVACMAKGARRPKSGMAGTLDTLNRIEMVYYWKDGRQVQQLGEVALLDGYGPIKKDLEKSTYAALPAELVLHLVHENEPSEPLYEVFVHGLGCLRDWDGDVRTHGAWQILRLLSESGFAPSLEVCGECGGKLTRPAGFNYASGAVCDGCASNVSLPQTLWVQLKAFEDAREVCPRFELHREGLTLLTRYASYHTERDFRSARVIEEVFGSPQRN